MTECSDGILLGPYGRTRKASLNEALLMLRLLKPTTRHPLMIDVGARFGSSLIPFAARGWSVHAFEPDARNRARLGQRLSRLGLENRVRVDPRAVGASEVAASPFYASSESTGISSLTNFHDTHRRIGEVEVTTLSAVFAQRRIERVDFLKIDTEGFDLRVLEGADWSKITPEAILCEFEDRKTKRLGYDHQNLGDFLLDKGYSVVVSEWHPVVRYGLPHDWCRLVAYPCELASADAWGNFLAFRSPPERTELRAATERLIRSRPAAALHRWLSSLRRRMRARS